jgi:hypothetical protein
VSQPPRTNDLTRRGFLAVTGALALGSLVGCGGSSGPAAVDQTKAWRFSTRDVDSASNAAKSHAANLRFVSVLAALGNRAHPGDKSKIVPIDIKPTTWQLWFGSGATQVDLRTL